jgi:hypothetical protein
LVGCFSPESQTRADAVKLFGLGVCVAFYVTKYGFGDKCVFICVLPLEVLVLASFFAVQFWLWWQGNGKEGSFEKIPTDAPRRIGGSDGDDGDSQNDDTDVLEIVNAPPPSTPTAGPAGPVILRQLCFVIAGFAAFRAIEYAAMIEHTASVTHGDASVTQAVTGHTKSVVCKSLKTLNKDTKNKVFTKGHGTTHDWCAEFHKILQESSASHRFGNYTGHPIWLGNIAELRKHLNEDCNKFDDYRVADWNPKVFTWPESGKQNIKQLPVLSGLNDTTSCPPSFSQKYKSCWMELVFSRNDYGPRNILLQTCSGSGRKIQLDRVQHVYNLFEASQLSLSLQDEGAILLEFGAGTGQMASVIQDSGFRGIHVAYDFLEMQLMQRRFHLGGHDGSRFITAGLDGNRVSSSNDIVLMSKGVTNYLPVGDIDSLNALLSKPRVTFVSTYAFTEADAASHDLFIPHFPKFDGFFIVFWTKFGEVNEQTAIDGIMKACASTHDMTVSKYFNNGQALRGVRKSASPVSSGSPRNLLT